jgi:hypothetical protein
MVTSEAMGTVTGLSGDTTTPRSQAADLELLGAMILELESPESSQQWVRRRTEKLTYRDERVMEREVELQINLSDLRDMLLECNGSNENLPIPIQTISVTAHRTFEIRDTNGWSIPYCDSAVERNLLGHGLSHKIKQIFSESGAAPPSQEQLDAFVRKGLRYVPQDWRSRSRRIVERALRIPGPESDTWGTSIPPLLAELSIEDRFRALSLVKKWSEKYVLLALITPDMLDGSRIIRFRTEESITRSATGVRRSNLIRAFALLRRILAGTLSWSAERPMYNAYRTASFHVDAVAPAGFKIIEPGLFLADEKNLVTGGRWIHGENGYASTHVVFKPTKGLKEQPAYFSLSLYAHRTGFVSEAAAASALVGLVLLAFTLRLEAVNFNVGRFDSPFASALVLFVPVLLSAIAVYKESSRIASSAFAFVRMALLAQFIAVIAAALPFAFRLSSARTEIVWYAAASLAWLGCVRVLAGTGIHSWRVSLRAGKLRRVRRRWEASRAPNLWKRTVRKKLKLAENTRQRADSAWAEWNKAEGSAQAAEADYKRATMLSDEAELGRGSIAQRDSSIGSSEG